MKILLVSSYLPYPLFSGGHIRLFNLLKELAKNHKITLVCEKRDYQTERDVDVVGLLCQKVITVRRQKQWSVSNILKTGLSFYPFLMVGHTNQEFRNKIEEQLREDKFDIIHVETFYVMQNIPQTDIPIVLGEQNIEYLVYKRFADQANPLIKPLLLLDVAKIKYWEEKFWKKAAGVVATSRKEEQIVSKHNSRITIVPNGVDLQKFKKLEVISQKSEVKTVLFIGDFRWIENRDAVGWLLKKIWPELEARSKKLEARIKLWIVGKNIPEGIRRLGGDNVFFDENAPDNTSLIYQKADLLLAPIRVGGGGKFKILESMASGVPVVTTKIGIEGIDAKDKTEVLLGDTIQDLVSKTISVLTDKKLSRRIVANARKLIEEKYDWRVIVKNLEKVYQSIT